MHLLTYVLTHSCSEDTGRVAYYHRGHSYSCTPEHFGFTTCSTSSNWQHYTTDLQNYLGADVVVAHDFRRHEKKL